jgi:hypothetical protein
MNKIRELDLKHKHVDDLVEVLQCQSLEEVQKKVDELIKSIANWD